MSAHHTTPRRRPPVFGVPVVGMKGRDGVVFSFTKLIRGDLKPASAPLPTGTETPRRVSLAPETPALSLHQHPARGAECSAPRNRGVLGRYSQVCPASRPRPSRNRSRGGGGSLFSPGNFRPAADSATHGWA